MNIDATPFIQKVYKMRKYQKQFFKHKNKVDLQMSQQLEKEVDKMLANLEGRGFDVNPTQVKQQDIFS